MESRTPIGDRIPIGYDIFRIWIPQKRKSFVQEKWLSMRIYDATPMIHHPNIEGLLQNSVPGKQAVLDIPDFRSRSIGLPYGIDETYRRKIPTQMDLKLKLKQLSWILPLRNR